MVVMSSALVACSSPTIAPLETGVLSQLEQPRLIAPLSLALNRSIQDSEQARTPEEARQKAHQSFFAELERLLQRKLSSTEVQLQAQAQWTATGNIQIQLQAQISDQKMTAQAQRQSVFSPQN